MADHDGRGVAVELAHGLAMLALPVGDVAHDAFELRLQRLDIGLDPFLLGFAAAG